MSHRSSPLSPPRPLPYPQVVLEDYAQDSGEQPEEWGVRPQRDARSRGIVAGVFFPVVGMEPGFVVLEACEWLFDHLLNRDMITEKCLDRHSLPDRDRARTDALNYVRRLPG